MPEEGFTYFGAQRLPQESWPKREERLWLNRTRLSRALNLNTTVAFVGAGCSAPLGYPTWGGFTKKMVNHTSDFLSNLSQDARLTIDRSRVNHFKKMLASPEEFKKMLPSLDIKPEQFKKMLASLDVKPEQYSFILGACRSIFFSRNGREERFKGRDEYFRCLRDIFAEPKTPKRGPNPYHYLLDLPIKRFITTNYDWEIENALKKKRNIRFDEEDEPSSKAGRKRSFTQKPVDSDQLALFAMARVEAADNLVFHCHGCYKDPESMVVTESDYQHWYLRKDSGEGDAFRQSLDLLFSSNPILFVGYGLGDDELMRPLRMLVADNTNKLPSRPLFALLPEEKDGQEEDYHQFLFDRYGLQVIPFLSPNVNTRGRDLCQALETLKTDWNIWWDGWLKKPAIRRVKVAPQKPRPYLHYPMAPRKDKPSFAGTRFDDIYNKFLKAIEEDKDPKEDKDSKKTTRVIALTGPGGTGKSWCAQRMMKILMKEKRKRFEGFFFWSSYYSYDSLTGLDRALSYLEDPKNKTEGSRIDRLKACLSKGRYLLIFDGIERFLREGDRPDEGRGFSPGATKFLECLADSDSRSVVVITSRLWPQEFNVKIPLQSEKDAQEVPRPDIERIPIQPFKTSDIIDSKPFNAFEKKEVAALCSLLNGHIYGIVLAAELLRQESNLKSRKDRLEEIWRALSATPPDRRISRMIYEAIRHADDKTRGLASKLLERVAAFMSPVDDRTIEICYESIIQGISDNNSLRKDEIVKKSTIVKKLVSFNLLQKVINTRKKQETNAYTMHPLVRGYVFLRIHRAFTDDLPDFTLPGFTAGTVSVDPGSKEGIAVVKDMFDRLRRASEQALQQSKSLKVESKKQEKRAEAVSLCRSAFGVVRSRMGALTAPRWNDYNSYAQYVLRLGNLAKDVSPLGWAYAERRQVSEVEDSDGPLYADELSWLYNEIGLSCYGEGMMLDALAVWEQGYEINRVIDSYDEGGNYLFQSQCNLGAAYIHLGRLDIAYRYLRDAERTNFLLKDPDHGARIKGYLALVQHLRGDFKEADRLYVLSLSTLKRQPGGNTRAESIFMRHHGDLKMKLGDIDRAKMLILTSRSLAEAGRYPELVAYSRLSYGHWYRVQKMYAEALHEYNAALSEARRIGIRRLESEALSELSRLAYDLGDAQIARQRAIESLRIANDSALGLRQTHGLVVLGIATIKAGQRSLGIAYLKHAKKLADRQEYWLRGSEAEEHLQRQGEPIEKDDVSRQRIIS